MNHVSDAPEAQLAEEHLRFFGQAQGRERQALEGDLRTVGRHDHAVRLAMVGERPGRSRRVGDCQPRAKVETAQAAGEIGQQSRLAAEQMRATRDIQEQAVGAVLRVPRRHQGRVAQAPEGESPQGVGVGGEIGST